MQQAKRVISFDRFDAGSWTRQENNVIAELPVTLSVNGKNWLNFMCTPTHLEALGLGFLYNETLVTAMDEIASLHLCADGQQVDIWTHKPLEKPEFWSRTSGCAGGTTSRNAENQPADSLPPLPLGEDPIVEPDALFNLVSELFHSQMLYQEARGVHSSALSDGQQLFLQVEDIGRHNTLDKIAGRLLLEAPAFERRVLLTTGRISSEMMQKAQRIGAPIVISITSPTSASIQLAEQAGITLVGYVRNHHFNVYTHPSRIYLNGKS